MIGLLKTPSGISIIDDDSHQRLLLIDMHGCVFRPHIFKPACIATDDTGRVKFFKGTEPSDLWIAPPAISELKADGLLWELATMTDASGQDRGVSLVVSSKDDMCFVLLLTPDGIYRYKGCEGTMMADILQLDEIGRIQILR